MPNPLLPPAARSAGRVVVWTLSGLVVVGVLASVWLGVRGYLAYGHLRDAQQTAQEIRDNLTDTEGTSDRVTELVEQTDSARSLTSDPVWRAAEHIPWVGDQLEAVSTASAAVSDVASSALRPLVNVAQDFSVDDLRPVDGRIDIAALGDVQGVAATSADRVGQAADRIDAIDRSSLLAPLADEIDDVGEQLRTVSTGADAIDRASQLLPVMLGRDGPRNYLLLFQNNAEARSLGGLVGAMALVRTEGGTISLETQSAPRDFPTYDAPVLPLGDERSAIFQDKPARFISNVTQVPDFAVSAQLAQNMWQRENGVLVDGVIAVDPIALSYVLEATGPLTLPNGAVINSDNAVQLLLNEPYLTIADPVEQDEFFETTAAIVFDALFSGAAEPGTLVDVLARAAGENRVSVWNSSETEQTVLDGTALQGRPLVTEPDHTRFGVFVNDGTPSKLSYYMRVGTGATWCSVGTGEEAVLEVSLRNDAPADAASFPLSVTGPDRNVPPGTARTVSYLYLPEGAEIVTSESSGPSVTPGFGQNTDAGRPVLTWEVALAPGEEATARVRVRTPRTSLLDVFSTPTVPGATQVVTPACSTVEAS